MKYLAGEEITDAVMTVVRNKTCLFRRITCRRVCSYMPKFLQGVAVDSLINNPKKRPPRSLKLRRSVMGTDLMRQSRIDV